MVIRSGLGSRVSYYARVLFELAVRITESSELRPKDRPRHLSHFWFITDLLANSTWTTKRQHSTCVVQVLPHFSSARFSSLKTCSLLWGLRIRSTPSLHHFVYTHNSRVGVALYHCALEQSKAIGLRISQSLRVVRRDTAGLAFRPPLLGVGCFEPQLVQR